MVLGLVDGLEAELIRGSMKIFHISFAPFSFVIENQDVSFKTLMS